MPRLLTIVSGCIAALGLIFILVAVSRSQSGWFGNSIKFSGGSVAGTMSTQLGLQGMCMEFQGVSLCVSYQDAIDRFTNQNSNANPEDLSEARRLRNTGIATLILLVFALVCSVCAIVLCYLRAFDVSERFRCWKYPVVAHIVAGLLALIAIIVFIGVVKKMEADKTNSGATLPPEFEMEIESLTPKFAWYLALFAALFHFAAAVVVFFDRKEITYHHISETESLNSEEPTYQ